MPSKYASGKHSIAECDRCGQRYKLVELKKQTLKTKLYNVKVCPECWDPDQPQLQLGMYPVNDPQAVREPRPDLSYYVSGNNGLQIVDTNSNAQNAFGDPSGGSRVIQWGWNPIGGASGDDAGLTPNVLAMGVSTGTLTVSITQELIMSFKTGANGIETKGKTKGKNLGDSGPTAPIQKGKGSAGVTSMKMKEVGRNMARAMNQKSAGRGR